MQRHRIKKLFVIIHPARWKVITGNLKHVSENEWNNC